MHGGKPPGSGVASVKSVKLTRSAVARDLIAVIHGRIQGRFRVGPTGRYGASASLIDWRFCPGGVSTVESSGLRGSKYPEITKEKFIEFTRNIAHTNGRRHEGYLRNS